MIRKIVKYTLRALAVLLGLAVLAIVALYLPPVQDFIKKKAVAYVSDHFDMRLSVERLRLKFPLRLAIDDAEAITGAGDTLFTCGSLRADVALLPLVRGEAVVRQLAFGDASFHLTDTAGALDLQVRVREFALEADPVDLGAQVAHISSVRLGGGDVRLVLGQAEPDTATVADTASAPVLWKIIADQLTLDDIAFSMQTDPVTALTARIASGRIDSCAVDLGAQLIAAADVLIEKGDYAYRTDTAAASPPTVSEVPEPADTAVAQPWTVRVAKVRLAENAARYGLPYGTPAEGFDPNHIEVNGLTLSLDSVFNRGTEIRAILADLTFTERSGLTVTGAEGHVAMDSAGYALRNFRLQTSASAIRIGATVGAGIASMEEATPMEATLAATLGTDDLFRLIEVGDTLRRELAGRELTIDTRLSGTLGDLRLNKLVLAMPQIADFVAEGRVRSVAAPDRLEGKASFGGALHAPRLAAPFLPEGVALTPVRFGGEAQAVSGLYRGRANVRAAEGKIALSGSFDPKKERYEADIEIDSLPLFRFLPADSLGYATLTLRAAGNGFDFFSPKTSAQAELRIAQAEYDRFDYKNMGLTVQLADNRLEGRLTSDNDALAADLRLGGVLTDRRQEAAIDGTVSRLDFERMRFTAEPASAAMRLDVQASATDAGAYAARIALDSLKIKYGTFENTVPRTLLSAATDTAGVQAGITSGDLKLDFRSAAGIDSLASAFARTAAEVQRQVMAGKIDTDTLERLLPPFRFGFTAGRGNVLSEYLRAQGAGFGQVSLTASAADGEPFGFRAEIDQFSTQGIVLDTLTAGIGGRNGQLQYFVRLANRPGNMNRMGLIALYGHAEGNAGQVTLSQRDREGRKGLDLGVRATLEDSTVTATLIPQHPILGFSEWTVNDGNYVRYGFDRTLAADLRVTRAGQSFSLQSATGEDMPSGSVRLGLQGIDIAGALRLLPTAPPVGGRLGTDLVFGMADSTVAARGRVTIDTLMYDNRRVGDIGLNLAYRTDTLAGQQGMLALTIDRRTALTVDGRYNPADSAAAVRLTADIPGIPLAAANPFLPEGSGSLSGWLRGHVEADGRPESLRLGGSLAFDSTAVDVAAIGTRFGITDTPIVLDGEKVLFEDFGLIAPNKHRLTVNGNIDLGDFSRMTADLRVRASDFQLVDVPRSKGSMVFGQASADLSARVRGPLDALDIRGDVNLLTGTEVTYVMQDSPAGIEDKSQNVVTFTAFNDTTTVYAVRPPSMLRLGGIDMLMNVAIDPDVQVSVYLSEDGQNRINLQGGGNLTYSMNRLGDTRFAGKYELSGGRVRYSPPVISTKDFTITPGGYVSWTGDIADPSFAIRAVETVRTTVTMEDQTSRQVNFQISINISGSLENLDIRFDLAAPEDLTLQNQLASLTAEQRQNQAMSLLIYNTYSGPGTSAKVNTGNPLNSFIAKELNQWAQNSLKGVDLSFGVDSYDDPSAGPEGTRTDYSYKLSKKFFDNRVRVTVGGKVSTGSDPNENAAENLVDDISLEYQLTRRDNMYLKLFRETNFESILEGEVTETGVGFGVRKKVLKLGDLFKPTKSAAQRTGKTEMSRKERKAERKTRREEKRRKRQANKEAAVKTEEPARQTE